MKKLLVVLALLISVHSNAQLAIIDIIKEGIKKVIVAVDLKVQRLQNKTIWLQQAQKTLENTLSKVKLTEIGDWVERQRKLYADYFDELRQAKVNLVYYQRVKDIIENQAAMVKEYKMAWAQFRQDKNFTADELDHMFTIYTGMMAESLQSLDQLFLVVNAFVTQMSDAKRLEIINKVAVSIGQNYMDLKVFNNENKMISIQRAVEKGEIDYVRKLYGLTPNP